MIVRFLSRYAVVGSIILLALSGSQGCAPGEFRNPPTGDSTPTDSSLPADPTGGDGNATNDSDNPSDGGGDPGSGDPDLGDASAGDPPAGDPTPVELTRGMRWVRDNPMFISALTVTMGAPPAEFVNAYFDDFDANATHLWARGLPTAMDGWAAAERPDFRWLAWVRDDGTSEDGGELIGGYPADSPGRIGYQVGDEPGLFCNSVSCSMQELQEAGVGIDAIRAHDPDALIFVNFSFYADGINQLLTYYGESMDGDIVSYDQYDRSSNSTYENLSMFRRAGLAYGKPYWRYMKAFYKNGNESVLTDSDMRWSAFSGLLYGYTGHSWFLYQVPASFEHGIAFFDEQGNFGSTPTPEWQLAAQINREMAVWGRAITQLTSVAVAYDPSILPPLGTTAWSAGAGGDPYLTSFSISGSGLSFVDALIGLFVDDFGEHYVMVQNVNHSNGKWPIDNSDDGTITLTFDFSSAPAGFDRTTVASLNKVTGLIESVALAGTGDSRTLSVELPAGDAFFFKYDTGAPFAMQAEP